MRIIGLVIAFVLLAAGLYRAFASRRTAPRPKGNDKAAPSKAAPSQDEAAPAQDEAAPIQDKAAPAEEKAAPVQDKAAPIQEKAAPAEDKAAPALDKTAPAKEKAAPPKEKADEKPVLPSMLHAEDADEDITIITLAPSPEVTAAIQALAARSAASAPAPKATTTPKAATAPKAAAPAAKEQAIAALPRVEDEDDEPGEAPSAVPIIYDEDASVDEPTRVNALILMSAAAQTDQGRRRRRNEDSLLVLEDHHLYVVADGMGGHAGGDVASKMAVEAIGDAFKKNAFTGEPYPDVPRRGAELALAIQMANRAIYDHAKANAAYQGMGTTVVSARFSPNKQRLYVGHVGDSRCYRLRGKQLTQVTTDHTMGAQGVTGPLASHLNRAVGVGTGVKVDLIIVRPRPEDVYLLCTDGLSKMVPDSEIQQIMNDEVNLDRCVQRLVERANARGGRDNITVILVQVKDPKGLARYIQQVGAAPATS